MLRRTLRLPAAVRPARGRGDSGSGRPAGDAAGCDTGADDDDCADGDDWEDGGDWEDGDDAVSAMTGKIAGFTC
ncbi:hypothetical protein GCM10009675_35150 [Prauserella alba]|uniref:Uncharacterized protein n=1 Tax=Prauserella alba TaxID=176898 RepID=A0ABN1VIS4_9PSEU